MCISGQEFAHFDAVAHANDMIHDLSTVGLAGRNCEFP